MSIIKISNLSFSYDNSDKVIFSNLNLNLDSSWKLGLVGRNGRGKTTFLNLLRGKLKGSGEISTNLTFSYFPIQIANPDNLVLYELQNQVNFEVWQLERELNLMQLNPDLLWQPFNTLSGGEQTMVLLALSFVSQNSFALIDEPTNHLDVANRRQVANYLKKHKEGYIIVSHDRDFLNEVSNHVLAIENNEIHLYQGNYASYEATKDKRDKYNQEKNLKLKSEIASLKKSARQIKSFSEKSEKNKNAAAHKNEIHADINKGFYSHKAAKIMKRSITMQQRVNKKITEKEGLLTNIEKAPDLLMNFSPNYHQTLLELQHLSLKIDNKPLFQDLNLIIKNHGIVALEGKNGSGKSTLLKFILNKSKAEASGKMILANGLKISYLPQTFSTYTGTLKEFSEKKHITYSDLLNNLKKMGFLRADFTLKIEDMSMGQQKRVALAKSLVEDADFYLWDEPANYLDVFNQDQLIKLLKQTKPAMILVEHDKYFIEQVADKKIKLTS